MASRLKRPSAPTSKPPERIVEVIAAEPIKAQFDNYKVLFPEIRETVKHFNECKREIPPRRLPDKMSDHRLDGKLKAFRECHLAPDVLLLYTHEGDTVRMLYICKHDDLYGKRGAQMAGYLKTLLPKKT